MADQLQNYFTQLRQIPSAGYFGLLGKQPIKDSVFWAGDNTDQQGISGLFDTEQGMLNAMAQKYLRNKPGYRKSEYYSRVLPSALCNHAPVFFRTEISSGRAS